MMQLRQRMAALALTWGVMLAMTFNTVLTWAQEEEGELAGASPTVPENLDPAAIENWFFSFLERFLNLIAGFILQIIEGTLGAVAGLF